MKGAKAAVSATPGLRLVDAARVLAEVLAWIDAPADLRANAPEIALGARRRLGAALATQRAAQVARALVHGTPSAALAEVGPALAAGVRRAAVEARW